MICSTPGLDEMSALGQLLTFTGARRDVGLAPIADIREGAQEAILTKRHYLQT